MNNSYQLSFNESFWLGLFLILLVLEFLRARSSINPSEVFKPTIILGIVLLYYAVLGPLWSLSKGEWFDRGIDRRSVLELGWAGAAIFYLCTIVGFYFLSTPRFATRFLPNRDSDRLFIIGSRLCILGFLSFSLIAGIQVFYFINPFTARQSLQIAGLNVFGGDGLETYFLAGLNLLIPGLCLLFTHWVSSRSRLVPLIFWSFASLGMFTTLGFRFRIVLVVVPLLLIWYLARQRRPNLVLASFLAAGLIFIAGFIGVSRTYGQGLDLSLTSQLSGDEIFAEGFAESSVFLTTSGMMAATPGTNPYVGFQPIISLLQFPVPRAFYPEKDTFGYLRRSLENLYQSPTLGLGAAILSYGEWFLMAGWPSLILLSLAFGWLLRCLWNWFQIRRTESLAVACYSLSVSFVYLVVSRGYMAQVFSAAIFTLLPLFWFYRRSSRFDQRLASSTPSPISRP